MSSYNLKRLLQPKSIALFGGLWIENVANQIKNSNFKGNVWPINPHRKSIAGYKCFQDISDLPGVPDTAFIGVNRTKTLEILMYAAILNPFMCSYLIYLALKSIRNDNELIESLDRIR